MLNECCPLAWPSLGRIVSVDKSEQEIDVLFVLCVKFIFQLKSRRETFALG